MIQRRIMITVFFGVDEIALLNIFPQGSDLILKYFQKYIIHQLAIEKCPIGRKLDIPRYPPFRKCACPQY
jgi:hypothetical protein